MNTYPQNRLLLILLLVVIVLAFTLRVYRLGRDASFTTDEITTITASMQSFREVMKLQSKTPLQALWVGFGARVLGLGYDEFAVYLLSVIVGVSAVVVIFFLGRVMFDSWSGLLSAFLLAFSAYHVYWSRSARYYALMVLLSSLAFLCLYQALITNRKSFWLAYALFRTLSLYDHLTALWILAGEGIFGSAFVLLNMWKDRRGIQNLRFMDLKSKIRKIMDWMTQSRSLWFGISMALIFLAYIPVWLPLIRDIYLGSSQLRLGGFSSEQFAPRNPRNGQPQTVLGGGLEIPFLVLKLFSTWITPLHVLMLVCFTLGLYACLQRRQRIQLSLTMMIMVTPFVLAAFVKSYSLVMDGRYLISLLPLYLMLASRGVISAGRWASNFFGRFENRRKFISVGMIAVFTLTYAGLNLTRIPLTFRNAGQNWRAVSQFLAEHARPDQEIIVHGVHTLSKALQYYLPEHNVVEKDPSLSYDTPYEQSDGFWLVFHPGTDMYTGLRQWLDAKKAVSIIFRAGWYPEIDRTTSLAPGQNWDLHVVYASKSITSSQEILDLHQSWMLEVGEQNPGDVRGHLTMAEAYKRLDFCGFAVQEYSKALREGYVNDQLASYIIDVRGRCWDKLGYTEFAFADWQRAIAYAEWSREPYKQLDSAYDQWGLIDEAQSLHSKALRANQKKAWPHVLLANFYRRRGMTARAIAEYNLAIELEPGDHSAYIGLAGIYAAEGEYARVLKVYQDAMDRNPWSGWPHLQLGQFYKSQGQVEQALAEYQWAVYKQIELTPIVSASQQNARWDLAPMLNTVQPFIDERGLLWWPGRSWVKPYPYDPDVLVDRSLEPVEGEVQPNQLYIHPFSDLEPTYIEFEIQKSPFASLNVGYGLADEIVGLSDGVGYRVEVRKAGDDRYEPLLDVTVNDNTWKERKISLLPYLGEEIQFRLVISAGGNYDYDWLQTTFELLPPDYPVWDLSVYLGQAQSTPGGIEVVRVGSELFAPDGSLLAGLSRLPVGGQILPGQVELRPYGAGDDLTLIFSLPSLPYQYLSTRFGFADEVQNNLNGVDYTISISEDGGESFVVLLQTTVAENVWRDSLVELPDSRGLVLKVDVSARGDVNQDPLQVVLNLVPIEDQEAQ